MTSGANWTLRRLTVALIAAALVVAVVVGVGRIFVEHAKSSEPPRAAKSDPSRFMPTDAEWASLAFEPASEQVFRAEHITEGKIAVNEDSSTPVFSPYAGRVVKLLVKPSDMVERGQPLFVIEATDTVQALNDFITALSTLNSARSKLNLAQINEKRQNDLYAGKAVPLKDWQQAQDALVGAQNDQRAAETALEAAHNRLRILGRSEDQITQFQQTRQISAETPIYSPLAGTVVQRKVGPGQYVISGASDPVFVVGDLSTVWLFANVREADAPKVALGQAVEFKVLSYPERTFAAKISYVTPAIDPATRRVQVRANVDNPGALLQPEMFANVAIFTSGDITSPAVPREAIIYEGNTARVWVAADDKSIELRRVTLGLTNGNAVEVRDGVAAGERVVTKGSLFIDRAAPADQTF